MSGKEVVNLIRKLRDKGMSSDEDDEKSPNKISKLADDRMYSMKIQMKNKY